MFSQHPSYYTEETPQANYYPGYQNIPPAPSYYIQARDQVGVNKPSELNFETEARERYVKKEAKITPSSRVPLLAFILGVAEPENLGWAEKEEKVESGEEKNKGFFRKNVNKILIGLISLVVIVSLISIFSIIWRKKVASTNSATTPSLSEEIPAPVPVPTSTTQNYKNNSYVILTTLLTFFFSSIVYLLPVKKKDLESLTQGEKKNTGKKITKKKTEYVYKVFAERLKEADDEEIKRCTKFLEKRNHFRGVTHPKQEMMKAMLYAEESYRGLTE